MGLTLKDSLGKRKLSWTVTSRDVFFFTLFLPRLFCCLIYIADLATDVALVERHFAEERCFYGFLTLLLIYLPSFVYFIVRIRDGPKSLPEYKKPNKVLWYFQRVGHLIFFPVQVIHRFAEKLFWAFESVRNKNLKEIYYAARATEPSRVELYLLFHALFQALPQALLQTFILASFKIPHERTGLLQFFAITTSIASAAVIAASYMRFESQRLSGRETPWSIIITLPNMHLTSKQSLMTTIESQITANTVPESIEVKEKPEVEEEQEEEKPESPKPPLLPKGVPQSAILSLPPLPPQIRAKLLKASGDELPEDLQKEYEGTVVEGEPLNIRNSIYGSDAKSPQKETKDDISIDLGIPQSQSPVPSLPDVPPPPSPMPLDIPLDEDSSEKEENVNSENQTEDQNMVDESSGRQSKMETATPSADSHGGPLEETDQKELLKDLMPTYEEPRKMALQQEYPPKRYPPSPLPLPTREKLLKGLDQDEPLGLLVAFIGWFLFITSRVLTLATLGFFCPWAFGIIVLLHYFGMVHYLSKCIKPKYCPPSPFCRLGLGFVFLFFFIEIKMLFKNPNTFTLIFFVIGVVENTLSSGGWFFFAEWSSWWFLYAFFLIISTMILSILCAGLYYLTLKPEVADEA